jgi:hypothetical protein
MHKIYGTFFFGRVWGHYLWSSLLAISCLVFSSEALAEVNFENYDNDGVTEDFDAADQGESSEMPEIEADQDDLRQDRKNGLGLSVGEVLPYTTLLAEYHRNVDTMTTVFFAFGQGAFNSSLQEEGEVLAINKVSSLASEIGYTKWISQTFPVALSGLVSMTRANGSLVGVDSAKGRHRIDSLGLGGDVRVQTFFENGFWLKWSLISLRYLRVIAESHSSFSKSQLATSRGRFSGFKILGITNITVGYSW